MNNLLRDLLSWRINAGGVARRGHVCGALTGGLMMIGFLTGRDDLEMFAQYKTDLRFKAL